MYLVGFTLKLEEVNALLQLHSLHVHQNLNVHQPLVDTLQDHGHLSGSVRLSISTNLDARSLQQLEWTEGEIKSVMMIHYDS